MIERTFNFSAGPGTLPPPVIERAREGMFSFRGSGMGVMELSHRSRLFGEVLESAESGLRHLLAIPDDFHVLFLHGGASAQFVMVPMNFLRPECSADYVITGAWGKKAFDEARRCADARVVFSGEAEHFKRVPAQSELIFDANAAYVHYTSNETIDGVQFHYDLTANEIPVICDASSDILSRTIDLSKYDLIYAGAQKNIGPSGVTVVIIKKELSHHSLGKFPLFNYRHIAESRSMLNTPNTWGIYIIDLVCGWLSGNGGVASAEARSKDKAKLIYNAIDNSGGFYRGFAEDESRSLMNVTFRLPSSELDGLFVAEALRNNLSGLKGHRTVGGIRASIYNAFPLDGVEALVDFMDHFAKIHA